MGLCITGDIIEPVPWDPVPAGEPATAEELAVDCDPDVGTEEPGWVPLVEVPDEPIAG